MYKWRISILTAVLLTGVFSTSVLAKTSANVGLVSEYYFRGINLSNAGAYAGLDYEEASGFYAGAWWIDNDTEDNHGLETDFYLGYNWEFAGGYSLGIGQTIYEYTYTQDNETEVNLYVSFGLLNLEFSNGEDRQSGGNFDYDVIAVSIEGEVSNGDAVLSMTYGDYSHDATDIAATSPVINGKNDYQYIELSASGELAGLNMTVSMGATSNNDQGSDDGYIFLDISKSFDL